MGQGETMHRRARERIAVAAAIALAVAALVGPACRFDAAIPAGALLTCLQGDECPAETVCVEALRLCLPPGDCVVAEGRAGVAAPDGSACSAGICLGGLCGAPRCGDALLTPPEECDDGNGVETDGCTSTCRLARCGDGFVQLGVERCDDGNRQAGDGCTADCAKLEVCGDGLLDEGELCDDGNANPNDECHGCRPVVWSATLRVGAGDVEAATLGAAFFLGVAVDASGSIYFADSTSRLQRLEPDGTRRAIAGDGRSVAAGDGGAALSASLQGAKLVEVDRQGRVYVASGGSVRRIDVDGSITTLIDGVVIDAIAVGPDGRLYLSDGGSGLPGIIRRQRADGTLETVVHPAGPFGFEAFDPVAMAFDGSGRLHIADAGAGAVARLEADGSLHILGAELPARLKDLAIDREGRIYVAGGDNARIWRIDPDETVTVVAGNGSNQPRGDGVATEVALRAFGVDVDPAGDLVILDAGAGIGSGIRRLDVETGAITTLAVGRLPAAYGAARSTDLFGAEVRAVSLPGDGTILTADRQRIFRIFPDNSVTVLAGSGVTFNGVPADDGVVALEADLFFPEAVVTDPSGRVLFADGLRVWSIEADGRLRTVAGNDTAPWGEGEGGPAASAGMFPIDLAVDPAGLLYIADGLGPVWLVDREGRIWRFAGGGEVSGDGVPALASNVVAEAIATDDEGRLYIVDREASVVRRVDADGRITTIAGGTTTDFVGDGGPATQAGLLLPAFIDVDATGGVLIGDVGHNAIRRVGTDGRIETALQLGHRGIEGCLGARVPYLHGVDGLAVDVDGSILLGATECVNGDILFCSPGMSFLVRTASGGALTVIGGIVDPPAAGSLALGAVSSATSIVRLGAEELLVSTGRGLVVRAALEDDRVDIASCPRALIGDEEIAGLAWDGASTVYASSAGPSSGLIISLSLTDPDDLSTWTASAWLDTGLNAPAGLAFDAANQRLLVADEGDHCVRAIDVASLDQSVVAGRCGVTGFTGDGGPATAATLLAPSAVALGLAGKLYIADTGNHRVRAVGADGTIETVLGDGSRSAAGAGRPARVFAVEAPRQLAVDSFGNLFVAGKNALRVVADANEDPGADGEDRALTIYEHPQPDRATSCLTGMALLDDATLSVADGCQGTLFELTRQEPP